VDAFIQFVQEWGYIAVFLGSIVEGESVILTASSMAALGYLNIYTIMAIAFITTTVVDQLLFFVGLHYGPSLFNRYPRLKPKTEKAFRLLHRFDVWFILSFRFIYGIRIISPAVIGAGGVSPARYIPLNIVSAFVWTVVSCGGGYLLGDVMLQAIHHIADIQRSAVITIGIGCLALGGYVLWKRQKAR
jgi:membrane protein DedA with SNARE-associated domain